ncbi:MAG: methylmalonyl-CoA epimerase [Acidobacteriota bacterium]
MGILPAGEIDHIGIAVNDLSAASIRYSQLLGARVGERFVAQAQQVEVLFLQLPGTTRLELVAPLRQEGPLHRFLQRRGEGLHHVCIRVVDLDAALESLRANEVEQIDSVAKPGADGSRIAFVHPSALGGVLLELKEVTPREPSTSSG